MPHVSFQLQAATDNALTALMLQHGLLLLGEGAPRLAPGVVYSHIGDAALEGGEVKLSGRYAFVSLHEETFGAQAAASMLLTLDPHIYKGPPIRYMMGGINWHDSGAVPQAVTMRQARQALLMSGALGGTAEAVDAAVRARIGAMPEPARSLGLIEWEFSGEVHRDRPLLKMLGQALGMSAQQIDDLFIAASNL